MIPVLFLGYFSELTGEALGAFLWTPALALTAPPCSDLLPALLPGLGHLWLLSPLSPQVRGPITDPSGSNTK